MKKMKADIAAIVASVSKPAHALSVYHELDDKYYSVTSRTFIGQVYVLLGLKNVADGASSKVPDYPQLSAECIIDSDPDLIVLADSKPAGRAAAVAMSVLLWLVRHGATDWSDAGRLTGWTDVPLNDQGRAQARRLARRLGHRAFTGVWSSDLIRSVETARLAADPILEPRLSEVDFGRLEGRRWRDISTAMQKALLEFDRFETPGGETTVVLRRRVMAFVDGLPEGDHVLFTHGGVIRVLGHEAGRAASVPPGAIVRFRLSGQTDRPLVLQGSFAETKVRVPRSPR